MIPGLALKDIHAQIVDAFKPPANLGRDVQFRLNVNLAAVVNVNAGFEDVVFDLLQWADGQGRVGDPDQLEQQERRILDGSIETRRDRWGALMIGYTREMFIQGLKRQDFQRSIRQQARFDPHYRTSRDLQMPME